MGVPRMNPNYVDEKYLREAELFGGGMVPSEGLKRLWNGFFDPRDPDHVKYFLLHKGPDGKYVGRWQQNSKDWVYAVIFSVDSSINAWAKSLPPEEFAVFVDRVVKPSAQLAMALLNAHCFVRLTENGETTAVKADLLALLAAHALARDGNMSVHVHAKFLRWAITQDNRVLSLDNGPELMSHLAEAVKFFHASVMVRLREQFGIKAEMIHDRAVLQNLPEQATNSVGTRNRAMKAWLEEQGIRPTGGAMAVAAKATREEKQDFDPKERHTQWNEQTGRVVPDRVTKAEVESAVSRLTGAILERITLPAKRVYRAYKLTWGKHPGNVKLHSAEEARAFLEQTRPRTRMEAHKAAMRALVRTNLKGLNHALAVARRGYKDGRKPLLQLPKGKRIVVAEKALALLTKDEIHLFRARAMKHGWTLRLGSQSQDQQQGQSS